MTRVQENLVKQRNTSINAKSDVATKQISISSGTGYKSFEIPILRNSFSTFLI